MISRVTKVYLRTTLRRLKSVSVSGVAVNTLISYLNLVLWVPQSTHIIRVYWQYPWLVEIALPACTSGNILLNLL